MQNYDYVCNKNHFRSLLCVFVDLFTKNPRCFLHQTCCLFLIQKIVHHDVGLRQQLVDGALKVSNEGLWQDFGSKWKCMTTQVVDGLVGSLIFKFSTFFFV